MADWQKTKFTGVEYRRHKTRKYGVKYDCYFRIRFYMKGKNYISGLGWASEGWTPSKAFAKLQEYRNNAKTGQGPTTFKEELGMREAEAARKAEQEQLKAKENITFSEFFETVYVPIAKQNVKERTFNTQVGHYRYWLRPVVGRFIFREITPFHLEKIKKNLLQAGRAPRTLQSVFAVFRQTWNLAKLQGLIGEDTPTRKVKLPRFDNKRVRYLIYEEAEMLLNELRKRSTQLYNISLLALHTGMRASEIFNLTWGNVDLDNGILTIPDSKSGRTRYAYLTEKTKAMLKDLQGNQSKNELVFKNKKGKKIVEISKAFREAVKILKLNEGITDRRQRVCFHTLRHTFASWMAQNGVDLYLIKELLGHSTIQLTERYSHLRRESLQSATAVFDKALKNEHKVVKIKTGVDK